MTEMLSQSLKLGFASNRREVCTKDQLRTYGSWSLPQLLDALNPVKLFLAYYCETMVIYS